MNKVIENQNIDLNNNINRILKGIVISVVLTLILLFIFSLILTYSNVSETSKIPVIVIISSISILVGSSISTRKLNKNGLLNGGAIGLIYMVILYIISSLAGGSFMLNSSSIIIIVSSIIFGCLGGIIGINFK